MSRTNNKWIRPYISGYRAGGSIANVGSLGWAGDVSPEAAYTDEIKNAIVGMIEVQPMTLNTILAPGEAADLYALFSSGVGTYDALIAYGVQAVPKAGDPIFAWRYDEAGYNAEPGSGFVMANVNFSSTYATNNPAILGGYNSPFGVLIHADGAETAANTAAGIDDNGAASTKGGVFFWHLLSSDDPVTLTLQEASVNSNANFANVTGATSGSVDASAAPVSGQVALSPTAAIKRYLRWQIALGSATTATFILGFHRGR
jgi:hypothetical protein